jgi:hypothetical protein
MNNPPAFPFPAYTYPNGEFNQGEGGMTLRDYFAAQAMQAGESRSDLDEMPDDLKAKQCYKIADAMLKARKS